MGFPSYIERLNAFSRYIESKTEADGWTLIEYEKTFAAFYYKEPLSKLDKWLKREQKPTIIVEAEIDDDGVIQQRVQPNQR